VQVKVQILKPDDYLRPEMNASVAFYREESAAGSAPGASIVYVPTSGVRDNAVFLMVGGKAVRRQVKVGGNTTQGLRIEEGLYGGEDLILNPPADLKEGARVKAKRG
jgi:HlyD family secretion protein